MMQCFNVWSQGYRFEIDLFIWMLGKIAEHTQSDDFKVFKLPSAQVA